jgi:hypothetical protein
VRSIFCGNDDGVVWKQPGSRSKNRHRHRLPAVRADRGAWWRFCAKPATPIAFEAIVESDVQMRSRSLSRCLENSQLV